MIQTLQRENQTIRVHHTTQVHTINNNCLKVESRFNENKRIHKIYYKQTTVKAEGNLLGKISHEYYNTLFDVQISFCI